MDVVDLGQRLGGLASSCQLQAHGLTRSQLSRAVQAGRLVRVLPRVYAASALPAWPPVLVRDGLPVAEHVLHVRAVLLALGAGAQAVGPTAAALRGWGLLHEPVGHVEVAVPHSSSRKAVRRARVRRRRSLRTVVLDVGGVPVPVSPAVETVLECAAQLPLLDAVVVADSALRSGEVRREELLLAARGRRARRVARLTDPLSGSVLESVFRVLLHRAGLGGWRTQVVVRDQQGRHVLRADVCFEQARLLVELDGRRFHQDARRDQGLDNRLVAEGWRVLRFSWTDVLHEPERTLDLLRAALAAPGAGRPGLLSAA